MFTFLAVVCAVTLSMARSQDYAAATFNQGGVRGMLFFRRQGSSLSVNASDLSLFTNNVTITIYNLPIQPGSADIACNANRSGGIFNPSMSNPPVGQIAEVLSDTATFTSTINAAIYGDNGIIGRSVYLTDELGVTVACATIVHVGTRLQEPGCGSGIAAQSSLEAVFNGRVAGRVTVSSLRETPENQAEIITVHSNLRFSDASNFYTGVRLDVMLTAGAMCNNTDTNIQSLGTTSIGNSSAGRLPLTVYSAALSSNLGLGNISSRNLAVIFMGNVVACAPLLPVVGTHFVADFGAYGAVTIRQNSRFESPQVMISMPQQVTTARINTLRNMASACSIGDQGSTFHQPGIRVNSMNFRTFDEYMTGDIGSKVNASGSNATCDSTLSLFGENSVAGRSVTLSRGSWQGCTNLVTGNSNEQVLRGKASFSKASAANAVQGSVYMEQLQGALGQVGVTTIFSTGLRDIRSSMATTGHNWHVHVTRADYRTGVESCGASVTGPHYNPFGVFTNGTYRMDCNSEDQLRCELGDTSGKSGGLSLDGNPFLLQDDYLPLTGAYSALGRSFVIHAANGAGPRISCGNIIPMTAFETQIGFAPNALNRLFTPLLFGGAVASTPQGRGVSVLYARAYSATNPDCTYVTAAIDGTNAQAVAASLPRLNLGIFTQDSACTEGVMNFNSGASSLMQAISVVLAACFAALLL